MDIEQKLTTVIYTCDRPINYLHRTVNELNAQGIKPKIMQGSASMGNLSRLSIVDSKSLFILEETKEPTFKNEAIIHRANRNVSAAFKIPEKKDILLLEDDVVPCKNLRHQLEAIYYLLARVPDCEKYIIALYSTYDWGIGPQNLMEYPVDKFYGLQACIFSANILDICSDYHYRLADELPADFVTKRIVKENGLRLLAARFSLFQHIGETTTGLGNFHRTANFLDGLT